MKLEEISNHSIFEYNRKCLDRDFDRFLRNADFIFHFSGVNRPKSKIEFQQDNNLFTDKLCKSLRSYKNKCPIVFSSSIQVLSLIHI